MKVLMAPTNFSGQPLVLTQELQRQGYDVSILVYSPSKAEKYNFGITNDMGRVVNLKKQHRTEAQLRTLSECIERGYDIFHFWYRTFTYGGMYKPYSGIDLPFLKSRGKRIIFRFTGSDLRNEPLDREVNPYSAFRYGYESGINEDDRRDYIAYLKEYVDQFVVQDPEMQQFIPEATVVPRAIDVNKWPYVGVQDSTCPLIVHAPTSPQIKGTGLILKAAEELKAEGIKFRLKLIENMANSDAKKIYKESDIVIDQIHIGAYGILSLECMALGKPVIVYIREDLFSPKYGSVPVMNANPDNIKEKMRQLIVNYDLRKDLGIRARSFVERHHDVRNVAIELKDVYQTVLDSAPKVPSSNHDIAYLAAQIKRHEVETRVRSRNAIIEKLQANEKPLERIRHFFKLSR